MPLWPHQIHARDALLTILNSRGAALDASDTGTGKTYVAAHVAKDLGLPVGVVAPKAVLPAWTRVLKEVGVEPAFVLNYEKIRTGNTPWFNKVSWNFNNGLLLFDEVHMCKSHSSINGKMLSATMRTNNRVLCMSATAAQSPLDMKALGGLLRLFKPEEFWSWAIANGVKRERRYGRIMFKFRGTQDQLADLNKSIFPNCGVRMRKAEMGSLFPENLVTAEEMDFEGWEEVAKLYDDVAESMSKLDAKVANDKDSDFIPILRARQKSETLKVPLLHEMAEELMAEGNSVVIFTNFNDTIDLLSERLNTTCVIRGEQDPEVREQNRVDFQTGASKVILCNIQAGGVGISLHDETGKNPRVSLICPTFSAVCLKQALGRIHRAGAKSGCIQKILFAANTVEEVVCHRLRSKLSNIDLINDLDLAEVPWQMT
jgi:superfamily II DNA or RNA helicase